MQTLVEPWHIQASVLVLALLTFAPQVGTSVQMALATMLLEINMLTGCAGQPASSTNGSSSTGQESLYSRLGGAPAVETVVHDFYQRLLADDRLNFFFDGFDIKRLKGHQVQLSA